MRGIRDLYKIRDPILPGKEALEHMKNRLAFFPIIAAVLFLFSCQKSSPRQTRGASAPPVAVNTQAGILKGIVGRDPKNLKAWIALGNVSMDSGRYQEAIDAYSTALKLDPGDVNVRVDMGTCYRDVGNPLKAIAEYKEALRVDPAHAVAKRNMGVVLACDLHRDKEAVKMFKEYLKEAPNAPDSAVIRQLLAKLEANGAAGGNPISKNK